MRVTTPETIILDGMSIRLGGQVTRIRAYLQRFRTYDRHSRLIVLEEDGLVSKEFGDRNDIEFYNRKSSRFAKALTRQAWRNLQLPFLAREWSATVYIHFSHYLPHGLPRGIKTIVGLANLQPFSPIGIRAEVKLDKLLRLAILKRTIISSLRRADVVICLSNTCKEALANAGLIGKKFHVIPNGVDAPLKEDLPDSEIRIRELEIDRGFLLYVSHFYRYKNFESLVAAYAGLQQSFRDQYQLVLVGVPQHREYWDSIVARVRQLGVEEGVRMIPGLGPEDLTILYRHCTLFVFPSLVENCPNILLEAMSCGAPVAASDLPPMPEFGGDAAVYFPPLDVDSIKMTVASLLGNLELLGTMRQRSPMQASRFTWDSFTERVVGLYKKAGEDT